MKAFIFFSIHEELFHRIALRLGERGIAASGFVWGRQQLRALSDRGVDYDPMVVFTRDLLPLCDDGGPPDTGWLEQRERELGVSIQRMLAAERHLLANRTFPQILRMVEVSLREIAATYDRVRPDFVFSEDISCFHSYAHFVLARERGIPFWCISSGRIPHRVTVYSIGFQRDEHVEARYHELLERGLTEPEQRDAEHYIDRFRTRPERPPGMAVRGTRPRVGFGDIGRFYKAFARYTGDPRDPTVTPPIQVIVQRLRRIARVVTADASHLFERPVEGERYVLYPIHFQPEASTLVQAPMYLDQVALLQDIAKSLPIGYRLYVKEHVSSRGRRPLAFYHAIRRIRSVRLLGPDEDTWALIRNAGAIAVITGTMGMEGLLFDKPVVTFGDVFYNVLPHVYRADKVSKDGWYGLFERALTGHVPDHRALLALISALHHATHPGFFGNSEAFPEVLDDDNVDMLTEALAQSVGAVHPAALGSHHAC